MALWEVTFGNGGFVSIVEARTKESAERKASAENGSNNGPYRARKATKRDVNYVKAMGGYVPDSTPLDQGATG